MLSFSKIIFSGLISLSAIFGTYFFCNTIDTFQLGNFALAEVVSERTDGNKVLLSVESNGQGFLVPVFIKDVEKEFFQFEKGSKIIFQTYSTSDRKPEYKYISRYAIPFIASFFVGFVALLLILFGWRVLLPFVSLALSLGFTTLLLFPHLLQGDNIILYGFFGVTFLLFISMIIANGFSRSSFVAAFCSVVTLCVTYIIGDISVSALDLFGYGGENISYLAASFPNIDLQGVFLVGIYLGVIGIIDDVTMAQTTAVQEIHEANPQYTKWKLYSSAMHVGKAHVFSMINTLVFAYIGVSIPSYFYIMTLDYPFWVIVSSTLFTEEFLRMIIGSVSLVLAIPFTTFVMAWIVIYKKNKF